MHETSIKCKVCEMGWCNNESNNCKHECHIVNTKSEHLTNGWLKWLLETGMSDIDSLMYNHWAENIDCECSVCTAFVHSEREKN